MTHTNPYGVSATQRVVDGLGYSVLDLKPGIDEPETRPMPSDDDLTSVVASLFTALTASFDGTALEDEVEDMGWSLADLFHRKADRMQTRLDDVETRIKQAQEINDGSEVASVELERLITIGETLMARRDAIEHLRDAAAEEFANVTGSVWRPRSKTSMVNHKRKTAAMIQGSDFISAKRRMETEVLIPKGTRIAFTGGADSNDHKLIWSVLDRIRERHPDMVLLHTGYYKGADAIAAAWARARDVVDVPFAMRPKSKSDRSAPWRRNEELLSVMPIGLVVFPGGGIQDNLADNAEKLGIKLADYRPKRDAAAA